MFKPNTNLVDSGFSSIGKFVEGSRVVVAGRPKIGTTTMLTQLAVNLCATNNVIFITDCMKPQLDRALACGAGIELESILNGTLNKEDFKNLAAYADKVSNSGPLVILEADTAEVNKYIKQNDINLKDTIVIVDADGIDDEHFCTPGNILLDNPCKLLIVSTKISRTEKDGDTVYARSLGMKFNPTYDITITGTSTGDIPLVEQTLFIKSNYAKTKKVNVVMDLSRCRVMDLVEGTHLFGGAN